MNIDKTYTLHSIICADGPQIGHLNFSDIKLNLRNLLTDIGNICIDIKQYNDTTNNPDTLGSATLTLAEILHERLVRTISDIYDKQYYICDKRFIVIDTLSDMALSCRSIINQLINIIVTLRLDKPQSWIAYKAIAMLDNIAKQHASYIELIKEAK